MTICGNEAAVLGRITSKLIRIQYRTFQEGGLRAAWAQWYVIDLPIAHCALEICTKPIRVNVQGVADLRSLTADVRYARLNRGLQYWRAQVSWWCCCRVRFMIWKRLHVWARLERAGLVFCLSQHQITSKCSYWKLCCRFWESLSDDQPSSYPLSPNSPQRQVSYAMMAR